MDDSYAGCAVKVEPVVAPPPGNPRFPLFDSLRAIAALSILVTHTALVSGANEHVWYGRYTARLDSGVAIFFLISGFLLYRPFVAARLVGHRGPRLRDYARRRVLRIVPAYWLALTVLAIYPGLDGMWTGHSWAYYAFVQTYHGRWTLGGIGPAWSLCIEVSFYVALPFLAFAVRRWGPRGDRRAIVRSELILLTLIFVASILVRATQTGKQIEVTLPAQADWFALGMFLAVTSAALAGREPGVIGWIRRYPGAMWGIAFAIFWYVSNELNLGRGVFARETIYQNVMHHLLYGLVGFFLLIPAVFADDGGGVPRRILRNKVLSWFGLISYGLFLWHAPIAANLSVRDGGHLFNHSRMLGLTLGTFVIATIVAALSYDLVERPILRYKDRPFRRFRRRRLHAATQQT